MGNNNIVEANTAIGNSNGIVVFPTANNNAVRQNLAVGNPRFNNRTVCRPFPLEAAWTSGINRRSATTTVLPGTYVSRLSMRRVRHLPLVSFREGQESNAKVFPHPRRRTAIIPRMFQRSSILFVIAVLAIPVGAQDRVSNTDRFGPLRFLAGAWRGDQAGEPGQGTAERTYQFVLNDRFLQETNTSTYPPQDKNKAGEVHHHMSMISYDGARKRFVFRQFHTEGFVNTYVQEQTTDAKTIVFVTEAIENIPAGYRARETYTILSNDEFRERFEIAEPGREFELYSEAHLKRIR